MKTSDRILEFIHRFCNEHAHSPSIREIGEGVGLSSSSTVHGHLVRLRDQGLIIFKDNSTRSIVLPGAKAGVQILNEVDGIPIKIRWKGRDYLLGK
jgi:repressor LexA